MFACALGAIWPLSIPAYLTYRYRVMRARRSYAVYYAEEQMRGKRNPYEGY
jgi:hypothetical protein